MDVVDTFETTLGEARSLYEKGMYYQCTDKAESLQRSFAPGTLAPEREYRICCVLAETYHALGDYVKSLPPQRRALEMSTELFGPRSLEYATQHNHTAMLCCAVARFEDAARENAQARRILEERGEQNTLMYGRALLTQASIEREQKRYHEEKVILERAEAVLRQYPETPEWRELVGELATSYYRFSDPNEARARYQEAMALRERFDGVEHPKYAACLHDMGIFFADLRLWDDAIPLLEKALIVRAEKLGVEHQYTFRSQQLLNTCYEEKDKQGGGRDGPRFRMCDHCSTLIDFEELHARDDLGMSCPRCVGVYFCSQSCELVHWRRGEHRNAGRTQPMRVRVNVYGVNACARCIVNTGTLPCVCKRVRYCSKKCKRLAWPKHREVCPNEVSKQPDVRVETPEQVEARERAFLELMQEAPTKKKGGKKKAGGKAGGQRK